MDENKILTKEQRLVLEMRNNLIRRRKQSKMRKAKNTYLRTHQCNTSYTAALGTRRREIWTHKSE